MAEDQTAINPFVPPRDWEEEAEQLANQFSFSWFEKWNVLRLIDETLRWCSHLEHSLERAITELEELIRELDKSNRKKQPDYESLLVIFSDAHHEILDAISRSHKLDDYLFRVRDNLLVIPPALQEKSDQTRASYNLLSIEIAIIRKKKSINALKTELALFKEGKSIPPIIIQKSEGLSLLLGLTLAKARLFNQKIEILKEAVTAEPSSLFGNAYKKAA